MPTSDSLPLGAVRGHPAARTAAFAGILLATAAVPGWLASSTAQQDGSRAPRHASAALESAARHVMALPAKVDGVVLAAQGTQEGHWRFVNKSGEMFTVGTPDEMKRVIAVLYPDAKAGARLWLYLTEDTVYRYRTTLRVLPANAELNVVVGAESYRLLRRSDAAGDRVFAEIRSNLAVEMADQRLFEEALWHLARPLGKARLRVLAIEPGGPSTLAASPRIDRATRRALVDAIDPVSLASALASVPGQTLLILGRAERDLVYVRPSSGPEHIVSLKDLLRAAGDADVNLFVLQTASTPRQPAGRNALWPGAEGFEGVQQAQVADLLNALAVANRRMALMALPEAGRRTLLEVTIGSSDLAGPSAARSASDRLLGTIGDITGKVAVTAVQANLLSAERQREIDRRILPGIPLTLQIGYAVLVVLGLLGMPVARSWWARVWPPEVAAEYAGRTGFWAARAIRGSTFLLVFLPLTGPAAGPYNLGRQIGGAVWGPVRWWRRRGGRDGEAEASALAQRTSGPPPLHRGRTRKRASA